MQVGDEYFQAGAFLIFVLMRCLLPTQSPYQEEVDTSLVGTSLFVNLAVPEAGEWRRPSAYSSVSPYSLSVENQSCVFLQRADPCSYVLRNRPSISNEYISLWSTGHGFSQMHFKNLFPPCLNSFMILPINYEIWESGKHVSFTFMSLMLIILWI